MKKTFKVVMLPAGKSNYENRIAMLHEQLCMNKHTGVGQHLYILSDEEIKEGDWVLGGLNGTDIKQYGKYFAKDWKKIVATTDKSLEIIVYSKYISTIEGKNTRYKQLPQLHESFIQAYIKSYNEGKPITEVDLEMQIKEWGELDGLGRLNPTYEVKTRPDNTVIVHQSKMYSRDELIAIMKKFKADTEMYSNTEFRKKWGSILSYREMEDKWIKDNL